MSSTKILAIETSCDETSIAIVENGTKVLAMTTNTQISTHAKYGGVVPEVASRMHAENITIVLNETLEKANLKLEEMDAIAVTYGPGLLGSLLVGVNFAKTLAYIYNKPLIAVNHLIGHIYANNLENKLEFPLLTLIVSGGHTELLYMTDEYKFKLLGETLDDAIGESFDKVAKVLGLPYPGGPIIEKLAKEGNDFYKLPLPVNDGTYNFSYSGLKSSVLNLVNNEKMHGKEIRKEDLAYSFQKRAVEEVCIKINKALDEYNVKQLVVAGGVSANKYLKEKLEDVCQKYNTEVTIPSILYCTDNAAMIGAAAYYLYQKKIYADLDIDACSYLNICD
ncbi:MAG: tRNA (adenosine(37)-N6)-threonylcarbamoyltransferase complex transferase subunit TsaD [Bacilli bacterium]|nr:tRNA (adenosine(37)-N6)-threonylcarbamoyltransferase complex transferase subunit TsaD [Bacilli bacterium]